MDFQTVMQTLEGFGTAQNRKIYGRHGVSGEMFGVSYANQKILAKKIKTDHPLAQALWDTQIHDAKILAVTVADPKAISETQLDRWVRQLGNYVVTDAFSTLVEKTPFAKSKSDAWINDDDEWISTAGWNLVARIALRDKSLPDAYFEDRLKIIESDIHTRKNRTRYSMNSALIAIGIRNEHLREQALAVAEKIGKVDVDHLQTSCKTPDAITYINKTIAHRNKKKVAQAVN